MCSHQVARLLWCAPSSERGVVQHWGSKSWQWQGPWQLVWKAVAAAVACSKWQQQSHAPVLQVVVTAAAACMHLVPSAR